MRLRDKIQLKNVLISEIKTDIAPIVKSLQLSLLQVQQKSPIKLRIIKDEIYKYEVVDGRRRLQALAESGETMVLAIIEQDMDNSELALQALVANSGTPNELDEAKHILTLEQSGYTGEQIAKMTGYSCATISQRKKLIEKLNSKGQELLQTGRINVSLALEATKLPCDVQEELFSEDKITSKIVHERVRQWQSEQSSLFDIENESDIKPGLFLTSEQVESLMSGRIIKVNYLDRLLNIKEIKE